jgi:SPP1 family predicted phage head-tail adaptor
MMDIGRLDKRLTFQRRSVVKDEYGQEQDAWFDVVTVWGNVKPIGGREKLRAMAIGSHLTHTVATRYNLALLPLIDAAAMRISYPTPAGIRLLNITAARDLDEAHRFIIFDCTEGSLDGQ